MGLQNWLHWMAWFVKSFLMMGFSAFVTTIILTVTKSLSTLSANLPIKCCLTVQMEGQCRCAYTQFLYDGVLLLTDIHDGIYNSVLHAGNVFF